MKLKRYGKYKQSGVEWLGEVPEHWGSVSLKWISLRYSGGTPDKTIEEYWEDGTIPWLNSGAVNDGFITEPSTFITEAAFKNSSAKWIPQNALVVALAGQGKTKGMVAHLGFKTTCNQSMAAIIPSRKVHSRFLYWWLSKNYSNLRNLAGGEARDGLNLDLLGSVPCPLLPLPEQQSIAPFLDRETGHIDALISKKQQLVELLKEKRSALISRAVTKGLNPKVKMKPSGVEWLGEVPEHWKIERLRRMSNRVTDGAHISPDLSSNEYPFVSTVDIKDGKINFEDCIKTSSECYEYLERNGCKPFENDILFSKDGTVGRTAVVDFVKEFVVASSLVIISPNRKQIVSKFLDYWLNGSLLQQNVLLQVSGAALRRISVEKIGRLPVVLPPLSEQTQISSFLDRETSKLDALISKVEQAIVTLKEYRTALISAAVTGKIDVREAA